MIEQLLQSLRGLAQSGEERRPRARDAIARREEIVRAYSDALLLVFDCPQVQLEPAQRAALERLEERLDGIRSDRGESACDARGSAGDPDWAGVSALAASALRILGHPLDARRDRASC